MLRNAFHILFAQIEFPLCGCVEVAPFLEIIGNWPLNSRGIVIYEFEIRYIARSVALERRVARSSKASESGWWSWNWWSSVINHNIILFLFSISSSGQPASSCFVIDGIAVWNPEIRNFLRRCRQCFIECLIFLTVVGIRRMQFVIRKKKRIRWHSSVHRSLEWAQRPRSETEIIWSTFYVGWALPSDDAGQFIQHQKIWVSL